MSGNRVRLVISGTELLRSDSYPKKKFFFRFQLHFLKKIFFDSNTDSYSNENFLEFRFRFRKIPIVFQHHLATSNLYWNRCYWEMSVFKLWEDQRNLIFAKKFENSKAIVKQQYYTKANYTDFIFNYNIFWRFHTYNTKANMN